MEEAVSGVKGQLATKVYGEDLHVLEDLAARMAAIVNRIDGIADLAVFQVTGQPDLNLEVDRKQAARFQINVADVQDAISTAVGGKHSPKFYREKRATTLLCVICPNTETPAKPSRISDYFSPSGERVSLEQLCKIHEADEGSEIYRENNERYVAIKYSVRGRALGDAVREAIQKVSQVKLPRGYHVGWEGEYQSEVRAEARLLIIVPLTVLLIFIILYLMFGSFKWAILILTNVMLARVGGLLALLITNTHFRSFLGRRIAGAFWGFGTNRSHHARIHQSTEGARTYAGRRRCRGSGTALTADLDDHVGRDAGAPPRRYVAWDRLRLPKTFRHCDCRRINLRLSHEYFPFAYLVRVVCARTRQTA